MALPFYNWSRTASSNATADSTVNWAEGQAPSSVNDSARAMMASVAGYRDDGSGAIATGGTSTAYTVSSYQVFDSLAHATGQEIAFSLHTANGATVTLNVDGLGAKPLRSAPATELLANAYVTGSIVRATYFASNSGEWIIQSYAGIADGQIATAKYAALSVNSAALAANAVTTAKITDANVTTAKIADANVTLAKIVNTAASRLLGNPTGSPAAPSEISLGTGLAFSGTTLAASISTIAASLGSDVALNNTANYFDGPSIAQGTSGTWFVSGTVTLQDTSGSAAFYDCKLWDGTTVIASCEATSVNVAGGVSASLSGIIAAPAANLRISVKDKISGLGKILFNISGNSKDSTISAIRIA